MTPSTVCPAPNEQEAATALGVAADPDLIGSHGDSAEVEGIRKGAHDSCTSSAVLRLEHNSSLRRLELFSDQNEPTAASEGVAVMKRVGLEPVDDFQAPAGPEAGSPKTGGNGTRRARAAREEAPQ
jgi:hypothetical protein